MNHPRVEPRELLPGESPIEPLDQNWVYLIKDEKIRHLFENALSNQPPATTAMPLSAGLVHAEEQKEEQDPSESDKVDETGVEGHTSIDFAAMPTQELFRIAIPVFETVIERMNARSFAINASMTQLLGQHTYKPNF